MIGDVVQHILDKGFFVVFTYDGNLGYRFRAWRYYKNDICQCEWVIADFMVSQGAPKEILIMEADMHLKQIDDNIAQRRLFDSVLK